MGKSMYQEIMYPPPSVRQRSLQRGLDEENTPLSSDKDSRNWLSRIGMDGRLYAFLTVLFMMGILAIIVIGIDPPPHEAKPSLQKAFVIFRHGTRAPGFTYKNDLYNKDNVKYWPDGPGELTATGKVEAYELGQRFRERYNRFIGDNYKVKEFRAFSTLIERTLMSAQLVLASFFPPRGYQKWTGQINWQPVPIYPEHIVNATSATSCPRFALEFKNNIKKLSLSDFGFDEEFAKLLRENSGEPDALPVSAFTRVWDCIYFQSRAHLPIPDWVKPYFPEKMAASAVKYLNFYLAGTPTQEKLVLDPFGRAITTFFMESPRKMEMHSLHDIHINVLFLLLGIETNSYPEPGSAIAIELHGKHDGLYFEVYYYPTPKDKVPFQMKMPCGVSCPFSAFLKRCKLFEVENYDELCNDAEGGIPTHVTEFKLPF